MKTLIFLWDMAPPLVRVVAIAAPVLFLAGLIAALVVGGQHPETPEAGS